MARFQTCPKCRALVEPGTRRCPYCEADQSSALGISESQDVRATGNLGVWIIGACAALYMLMVVLDPARGDKPEPSFEPTGVGMHVFGIHSQTLVRECHQYWRIVTANFVHLDLLHLLMNSVALFFVVSMAGATFGVHRTWVIYFLSGVLAVAASNFAGNSGGGASGAICGMVGALAVYGQRRGGFQGRMLTRRMLGWALIILAYGIIRHGRVDNVAHGAGFAAGAALGWFGAAARARGGRADRTWTLLAHGCTIVVVLVGAAFLLPNVLRSRERQDILAFDSTARIALKYARSAPDVAFRGPLEPGPGGSDDLTDAINRAVQLRETNAPIPERRAAIREAEERLYDWRERVFCSHQIEFRSSP